MNDECVVEEERLGRTTRGRKRRLRRVCETGEAIDYVVCWGQRVRCHIPRTQWHVHVPATAWHGSGWVLGKLLCRQLLETKKDNTQPITMQYSMKHTPDTSSKLTPYANLITVIGQSIWSRTGPDDRNSRIKVVLLHQHPLSSSSLWNGSRRQL